MGILNQRLRPQLLLLALALATISCTPQNTLNTVNPIASTNKNNTIVAVPTVSSATMDSGKLTLSGKNLDTVTAVSISGNSTNKSFTIMSQAKELLQASITGLPALNIMGGLSYNLLITAANATSIIPITFEILDNSIATAKIQTGAVTSAKLATKSVTYEKIDTTGASNGQVMTYSSSTGKWGPANAGSGSGNGVSAIFKGTGITMGDGISKISTTGTISVDVGVAAGDIPQFDPSDGYLAIKKAELRVMQNDENDVDVGMVRQIYWNDTVDDDEFVNGDDNIIRDMQWKFNNDQEFILYDSNSAYTHLRFTAGGTGSGMAVGGNVSITGNATITGATSMSTATTSGLLTAATATVTGTFTNPSDERLKDVLGPSGDVLEALLQVPVWRYRYKEGNALGITYRQEKVGVIAQELRSQVPNAVEQRADGFLYVKQDAMLYYLLKGLQETEAHRRDNQQKFQTMHEGLDQRVSVLERSLHDLEARHRQLQEYLCQRDPKAPFCL